MMISHRANPEIAIQGSVVVIIGEQRENITQKPKDPSV
jgi:hypothetical protein